MKYSAIFLFLLIIGLSLSMNLAYAIQPEYGKDVSTYLFDYEKPKILHCFERPHYAQGQLIPDIAYQPENFDKKMGKFLVEHTVTASLNEIPLKMALLDIQNRTIPHVGFFLNVTNQDETSFTKLFHTHSGTLSIVLNQNHSASEWSSEGRPEPHQGGLESDNDHFIVDIPILSQGIYHFDVTGFSAYDDTSLFSPDCAPKFDWSLVIDEYGNAGIVTDSKSSHIDRLIYVSPIKQFNSGIPIDEIQCKEGLELLIKSSNGSPACVSHQSAVVLLIRGWSNQDNELTIDLSVGQRGGSFLVKEIFSDHVSGLNFMEYPIAREEGFPITLHIGESASNGCTVELTLLKINDNTATFLKKEHIDRPCPICLSEDTVIDTPDGPINVKELKKGMSLFTQDVSGNRNVGTVLETGKTLVPPDHKVVHIVLTDKRELYASPNHPTSDGRILRELSVGDILDGTKIMIAETIPYGGTYTYDILPSGPTGHYWTNEILMKTTLK